MVLKNLKALSLSLVFLLSLCPTTSAAPNDDIFVEYLQDDYISFQLYGFKSGSHRGLSLIKTIAKDGTSYFDIRFYDSYGRVKSPLSSEALIKIGDKEYPIRRLRFSPVIIEKDIPYLTSRNGTSATELNSIFYRIPDEVIEKIATAPENTTISLVMKTIRGDFIYEKPFFDNLYKAIPIFYKLQREDIELYYKEKIVSPADAPKVILIED